MKLKEHLKELQISNLVLSSKIEGMGKVMKTLPTKNDLSIHAKAIDEALATIQEVSTELTVHMEEYKMSGSTTHAPRSVQAGPSYTHPEKRPQVEE
jgi:division protein CdvB (Snf7/Vps24/ESCRT-III family)